MGFLEIFDTVLPIRVFCGKNLDKILTKNIQDFYQEFREFLHCELCLLPSLSYLVEDYIFCTIWFHMIISCSFIFGVERNLKNSKHQKNDSSVLSSFYQYQYSTSVSGSSKHAFLRRVLEEEKCPKHTQKI